MRILILVAIALLSGCACGHNYSGALLLGIFREQAEADAAERRAKGVGR